MNDDPHPTGRIGAARRQSLRLVRAPESESDRTIARETPRGQPSTSGVEPLHRGGAVPADRAHHTAHPPPAAWRPLGELLLMVLVGTVLVLGVDAVFLGRVNGAPAIYPMILLGLPVWELLTGRLPARADPQRMAQRAVLRRRRSPRGRCERRLLAVVTRPSCRP